MIGASPKRKEDRRLLTGAGRYVDDLRLPAMVHLVLVRSPHAHARVLRIDATAALRLPGVLSVLTVRDAPELAASVPALIREPDWPAYVHPVMAGERVRHVGEAVAVVVADDPYRAADGVDAVVVDYEPLP
ncbi:MAG TPA: xanthine dehydrogenase family protein molybdopterin-binding subunit, partial [Jatrophihabitantaceae bacterium]|nr:xanthine dehydrogenase family protein molybdopterin-binding subunit [Jatrophihabitantaceae bacterium]